MKIREWARRLKRVFIKHPVMVVLVVCMLLLFFVYIFLAIMKVIDYVIGIKLGWDWFTQLDGGINTWFSFFGSYFGVIATVVLGIITLRLSIKLDDMNWANKINEVTISNIFLYDLWRGFKPSIVKNAPISKRFVLRLELENFAPYYTIEVEKVKWMLVNKDYKETEPYELQHCEKQCIRNGEQVWINIFFDDIEIKEESVEPTFNYFWMLNCYEPVLMRAYERQRVLEVDLKMENQLFQSEDSKNVTLKCKLEYGAIVNGVLSLSEIEHQINIEC